MADLLQTVEKFCADNHLSEWQFGEAALNDRHFVRQLRTGRDLRMSTVTRVQNFMRDFRNAERAA